MTVHYRGTLIDGTEFDSSYNAANPSPSLGQRHQRMDRRAATHEARGKTKFYIPQELAYGANPNPNGPIPPYAALISKWN